MREIKFRAWGKYEGKMIEPHMVDECTPGNTICFDGSITSFSEDGDVYNSKDEYIILMQYTGLKDKNGKEIFEGDVVSGGCWYGWEGEAGTGIVRLGRFRQDNSGGEYGASHCLGFYVDIITSDYASQGSTQSLYEGDDLKDSKKNPRRKMVEVIGNIYENPELLTKPTDKEE